MVSCLSQGMIASHDFERKVKDVKRYLEKGDIVKVSYVVVLELQQRSSPLLFSPCFLFHGVSLPSFLPSFSFGVFRCSEYVFLGGIGEMMSSVRVYSNRHPAL